MRGTKSEKSCIRVCGSEVGHLELKNGGACTNKKDIYGGWNEYSIKKKNHENGYQKDSNLDLSHKRT